MSSEPNTNVCQTAAFDMDVYLASVSMNEDDSLTECLLALSLMQGCVLGLHDILHAMMR